MNTILSKLQSLPLRGKCFFAFLILLTVFIYGNIYFLIGRNDLTDEKFLETDKCPACYGESMCFALFDNQVDLTGLSKIRSLDLINIKNVHFAKHKLHDTKLVLKKLAHDDELRTIDTKLCQDVGKPPYCDLARNLHKTSIGSQIINNGLMPAYLNDSSAFMFACPSLRLIDRVLDRYKEKAKRGVTLVRDKLQLWYTSLVNCEPLMLQAFPASEGWPFPEYFGACGRFIVVSDQGRPLKEYYDEPWEKRADIAFQIMKIADKFTNNKDDFALYLTDLALENLAIDPAGKVTIVDAENIIVVDKMAVKRANLPGWQELHESSFDECLDSSNNNKPGNCLSFSQEHLCTHLNSDHNYYAVCRNLLSSYANDRHTNRMGGLLHNMPNFARDDWDLENLLNKCVRPDMPQGRIQAANKLIHALDVLRGVKIKRTTKKRIP
ncbi:hypothetical protein ACJMK2_017389 [Sinanodonta woodiana]|uniref:FAM69 protein-kinase domain-containing protein n=1 Tax=Sinanodonta woodiana TaxID=1069815 RepID=A0ABD3UA71_SINWO